MKILYFTDTHDMGRNPGSRIDDYHSAIFAKMNEAIDEAIARNVDIIVHGGDWFNHPKVSNIIYNQHQRMLQKARVADIPVYCVPGNHDLFGYSMSTIDQTSIGSLADAKLITLLTQDTPVEITGADGVKIAIYGREYSVDIDHDPANDYEINVIKSSSKNKIKEHILFSHGMLLDKPFHPDVRHSLTKDVVTDADWVFNGHYHPGWKQHTIGNTTFVNNGSTGRNEGSTGNLTFVPQYTIIESDGVTTTATPVPYKCAAAGKDIFDRTQLVQNKQHTKHLEAFEQTIHDALAFDAFNPKDILLQTKSAKGLSQKILDETLAAIVEQEQLAQDSKLDGYAVERKPVWIEEIEIINFESHKHTTIKLDAKGVNALTGASDSGKSGIVRAIRFATHNEPKGADFIRNGTKRATVRLKFSNKKIIERSRTKTSAGEYIVTDENGVATEFKGFGNNIPMDVLNAHQMPKVELATGVERSLNVAYQLDGHFMLSDSPVSRASAIGRLIGVHLVDAAIREKSKEMRALTVDTNTSEKRIEELNTEIAEYEFIDKEDMHLKTIKGFIMSAEHLEKKIDYLSDLNEQRLKARKQVAEYQIELDSLSHIDAIEPLLTQAEELSEKIDTAKENLATYQSLTRDMKSAKEIIASIDIDGVSDKLAKAEAIYYGVQEMTALQEELESADRVIKRYEQKVTTIDVYNIDIRIAAADDIIELIDGLKQLKRELDEAELLEAQQQRTVDKLTIEVQKVEDDMDDLLSSLGNECPLCSQNISDVRVLTHSH